MARIHEHELGLSWVMDDAMQRGSHALLDDGKVWLIDPVEDEEALARAAALGPPAGVIQLLDRHNRDCATLATRLGVEHLRVPDLVPGAPFETRRVAGNRLWKEVALWWPQKRALIVAEALGTNSAFAVGDGPVGVHPMLRLLPPNGLKGYDAEHLLVGHGPPVHGATLGADVDRAIGRARHDLPKLVLKLPGLIKAGR
jgi:hypothetical protein